MEISNSGSGNGPGAIKPDQERTGEVKIIAASESANPADDQIGESGNNGETTLDIKIGDEDRTEEIKEKDVDENSPSNKPFYTKNGMDFANRYKY